MQEKITIARPYAMAAFSFAEETNDVAAWSTMLDALANAVVHPDLMPLIKHPRVSDELLHELLCEIISGQLNDKRTNFISALLDAERLELAPEIAELFERRKAAAEGVADVVGAEFGKAFGAIPALQEEGTPFGDICQGRAQLARFTSKDERRQTANLIQRRP